MNKRGCLIYAIYVILAVVLIGGSMFRGVFVDQDVAIRALETHGFSEIEVIDHAYFCIPLRGGSESDAARFECKAINPAGKPVTVYVYSGWLFKGATVRTD